MNLVVDEHAEGQAEIWYVTSGDLPGQSPRGPIPIGVQLSGLAGGGSDKIVSDPRGANYSLDAYKRQ